jgi:hypothetical protein
MSIFNLKLKRNTWFLRVGPFQSLIPATWKGALIYIGTIVGGILLANASVTAARGGAKSDAELYGFGFVVVLLLFFIVGYKKSQRM